VKNLVGLLWVFLLANSAACVPVYLNLGNNPPPQPNRYESRTIEYSSHDFSRIQGYIAPVIVNEVRFDSLVAPVFFTPDNLRPEMHPDSGYTYDGMVNNTSGYIENCKCVSEIEIISDKLVLRHAYGGRAEGNRDRTNLLWNGKYYKNSSGELVADVIIDSPPSMFRLLIIEPKIFDIVPLQAGANGYIWIHVVGFDHLIRYTY
jgi:hypothetical protein